MLDRSPTLILSTSPRNTARGQTETFLPMETRPMISAESWINADLWMRGRWGPKLRIMLKRCYLLNFIIPNRSRQAGSMASHCDFLVLGSGIAGLLSAHKLSSLGTVTIVTKKEAVESNTNYAQGGIAAVTGPCDNFESHIEDPLNAGAGLCDERIVRLAVEEGPQRVKELRELGGNFSLKSRGNEALDLGLEAGHSQRRILHAGDITGREIERALVESCRRNPRIRIVENHSAVNLILDEEGRARGAYAMDRRSGLIKAFGASAVILATGGAGKVYIYTSNPDIATGDGMAMAYRAGATLANMEFVQFHPTCLFHPKAKTFLLSEALRGEGGLLRLKDGTRFMDKVHPMK